MSATLVIAGQVTDGQGHTDKANGDGQGDRLPGEFDFSCTHTSSIRPARTAVGTPPVTYVPEITLGKSARSVALSLHQLLVCHR